MRILIAKEKYGNSYYDVSTDELLHKTCVSILKARLEEGWYGSDKDSSLLSNCGDNPGMTMEEANKLPEGSAKESVISQVKQYNQEMDELARDKSFRKNIKSIIVLKYDATAKDAIKRGAFGLLNRRSNKHEYEGVELEELMNIEEISQRKK